MFQRFAIAAGTISSVLFLTAGQIWQYPGPRSALVLSASYMLLAAICLLLAIEADDWTTKYPRYHWGGRIAFCLALVGATACLIAFSNAMARLQGCFILSKPDLIGCTKTGN